MVLSHEEISWMSTLEARIEAEQPRLPAGFKKSNFAIQLA